MARARGPRRRWPAMRRLFVFWWCCASAITILALGWFPGILVAVAVGLLLLVLVDALAR